MSSSTTTPASSYPSGQPASRASAQDIAHALGTGIAPTPQNTPAAHLSHSVLSRPQVPATLDEEREEDDLPVISSDAAAGLAGLASNPAFASLVQNRLSGLVGRSSGYIESLPPAIQHRITALKGVQVAHSAIEAEFQKDIFELEKKYAEKYRPVYERRRALVEGASEPTDAEWQKGLEADSDDDAASDSEDDDDEDEDKVKELKKAKPTPEELAAAPKGIPEFWLTALKNHLGLSELITERDEEALKFLVDVRLVYPADKPGFTLVFDFAPGAQAFFKNPSLEKTYYYQDEVGYEGDFVYDRAVGTKIDWVDGKDLTVRIETKKQRNKNTNQTRIVKKVVPTDSFFSFFSPPTPPEDSDDEAVDDDIDEKLELDYQIGEDLKERVVPRAVDFFTGKALRYEQDDDFGSDDEDDEDDDLDDDDDDDDDEGGAGKRIRGAARKAPAPPSGNTPASHQDPQECKQS